MRSPAAIGTNNMPIRTPITESEGERLTATAGGSETTVPEKNLCTMDQLIELRGVVTVVKCVPIEKAEPDHTSLSVDVNPKKSE